MSILVSESLLDAEVNRMVHQMISLGFTEANSAEYSERPARGVLYYGRVHEGQHQRVSLVTHPTSGRSEFLQAVVQVFDKAPSIGRPKGKPPTFLHASEPRCWEDLLAAVTRVYPLPTP